MASWFDTTGVQGVELIDPTTGQPITDPTAAAGTSRSTGATTQPQTAYAPDVALAASSVYQPTVSTLGGATTGTGYSDAGLPADMQTVNPGTLTAQTVNAPAPPTINTIAAPTVMPTFISGPSSALTAQQVGMSNFTPPTGVDMTNDPAYQFDLSQGLGALQNSSAASGIARTGGALEGLIGYAQNNALNAYQQVYNNAANTYGVNLNAALNTTSANNAANATAYGLTNQYQQNAALANQANLTTTQATNAQANYATQAQNASNQLSAYNAYAPLSLSAQGTNATNALNAGQLNNTNALNAANANNTNALAFGTYGANLQNQGFNQALAGNNQQFNQYYQLAQLGNPTGAAGGG